MKSTDFDWKQTGLVCAAGLAGIFVTLERITFHRAFEKQILRHKFRPRRSLHEKKIREGMDWIQSMQPETVSIQSRDNLTLVGHYLKAKNEQRTVILCHGWHSRWDREFAQQARFLHENNCSLLFIEQRAQQASQGRYCTFGLKERYDLEEWAAFINARTRPKNLYYYGISMGAATALMAAGSAMRIPNLKGIIADCGFSSVYEIILCGVRSIIWLPEHPFMDYFRLMTRHRLKEDLLSCLPSKEARKSIVPILIIHGTSDTMVPVRMSWDIYDPDNPDHELLIVPGAGHCRSFETDTKAYIQAVLRLFQKGEKSGNR